MDQPAKVCIQKIWFGNLGDGDLQKILVSQIMLSYCLLLKKTSVLTFKLFSAIFGLLLDFSCSLLFFFVSVFSFCFVFIFFSYLFTSCLRFLSLALLGSVVLYLFSVFVPYVFMFLHHIAVSLVQ